MRSEIHQLFADHFKKEDSVAINLGSDIGRNAKNSSHKSRYAIASFVCSFIPNSENVILIGKCFDAVPSLEGDVCSATRPSKLNLTACFSDWVILGTEDNCSVLAFLTIQFVLPSPILLAQTINNNSL